MIPRRLLVRALAVLGLVPAAAAAVDSVAPERALEACDARIDADLRNYAGYMCCWLTARGSGAWESAVRRMEARLAREPHNEFARLTLARLERDRGGARAEELFRLAADGFAAKGAVEGETFARLGLAERLRRRGALDDARRALDRADALARGSGRADLVANAGLERAWLALRSASYDVALARFEALERDVFPSGPGYLQSAVLSGLGAANFSLGQFQRAFDEFERSAALCTRSGDLLCAADELQNQGLAASKLVVAGVLAPEEQERIRTEALTTATRSGNRRAEAAAHLSLAEAPSLPLDERAAEADRALALARAVDDASQTAHALRLAARLTRALRPGCAECAFRYVDDALALSRARNDAHGIARGLIVRAELVRSASGPDAAEAAYDDALDAIETLRSAQADPFARALIASEWSQTCYRAAGLLLERGRTAPAFEVLERLRARALREEIARADEPAGGGDRPGPAAAVASIADVQASLREDEALIAFQLAAGRRRDGAIEYSDGGSWVVVLTRVDVRSYPIPDEQDVDAAVALFTGLVGRRDGTEAAAAGPLGRMLLEPALRDLPRAVENLVVVPDRSLHRLAFDALRLSAGDAPLGTRFRITLAPSATLWLRWRRAAPAAAAPVRAVTLVLADPALDLQAAGPGSVLGGGFREVAGTSLPAARREGTRLLRRAGGAGLLLTGAAASESALVAATPGQYTLIHLATHAVIDENAPARSAVLLASGGGQDGLLHAAEAARLHLDHCVVVLAACRGASGTVLRGEGAVGLARGFLVAGSSAVVGTLWPIRDDDAEAFFAAFYGPLTEGATLAEALRSARRTRVAAGAPASGWAGFVLVGDGAAAPYARGRGVADGAWRGRVVDAIVGLAGAVLTAFAAHAAWRARKRAVRRAPDASQVPAARVHGGTAPVPDRDRPRGSDGAE